MSKTMSERAGLQPDRGRNGESGGLP
jgi:hypothetical protein